MAQLMCEGLCVGYDGKAVLKDLNFEVAAGDYLCIVGANGSGKSTLMKTILGLQPPVSGSVIMGDGLQRKEISYLPQQTSLHLTFLPTYQRELSLIRCFCSEKRGLPNMQNMAGILQCR